MIFKRRWFRIVLHSSLLVCFLQLPELSCRVLQLLESPDLSTRRRPVYLALLLPQTGTFSNKNSVAVSGHQVLPCYCSGYSDVQCDGNGHLGNFSFSHACAAEILPLSSSSTPSPLDHTITLLAVLVTGILAFSGPEHEAQRRTEVTERLFAVGLGEPGRVLHSASCMRPWQSRERVAKKLYLPRESVMPLLQLSVNVFCSVVILLALC